MIKALRCKATNVTLASIIALGCAGAATTTALVSTATDATLAHADEWKKSNGSWWYQTGKSYATGWKKIGGKWYYFDSNGWMKTGWQKISGKWYYLKSSGAMVTGWNKVGGTWYYHTSSGAMKTGWNKINGKWYYFDDSGAMATGLNWVEGKNYYHSSSGAMLTGWQFIENYYHEKAWYYFYSNGVMAKDAWVGDYYLKSDGTMATNLWIGNFHVNTNGAWDKTRDNSQSIHIETNWYEIYLPASWKDKVSYYFDGSTTVIHLAGHKDCVLFCVYLMQNSDYLPAGDIGTQSINIAKNSDGYMVRLSIPNWPWRAAGHSYENINESLIEALIELQTDETLSLKQIKSLMKGRESEGPDLVLSASTKMAACEHIQYGIGSNMIVKNAKSSK